MTVFRARSRSTRAIFFHVVLLVALLWLCGSSACVKATKAAVNVRAKKISVWRFSQSCPTPSGLNSLPCPLGRNSEEQRQVLGFKRRPFKQTIPGSVIATSYFLHTFFVFVVPYSFICGCSSVESSSVYRWINFGINLEKVPEDLSWSLFFPFEKTFFEFLHKSFAIVLRDIIH